MAHNPTKRRHVGNTREYNNNSRTTFSVKLIQKALQSHVSIVAEVSFGASIYLAGVLEYLIAEILDTAISQSQARVGRLEPDHILTVLHRDEELTQVFPTIGQAHYHSGQLQQVEVEDQQRCSEEDGYRWCSYFNMGPRDHGYLRSVTTGVLGLYCIALSAVKTVCVHLKRVGSLVQSHLV